MEINWKTRLNNKTTLAGLISTLLLLTKQIFDIFGIDISTQVEQITGIVGTILGFLTLIGVLTNPNTQGASDAGIDMELDQPRNQNIQPVEFKTQGHIKQLKTFDTSQPFTDDSDEFVYDYATVGGRPDENTSTN